jgi:hypothetical protein
LEAAVYVDRSIVREEALGFSAADHALAVGGQNAGHTGRTRNAQRGSGPSAPVREQAGGVNTRFSYFLDQMKPPLRRTIAYLSGSDKALCRPAPTALIYFPII